MPKHYQNIKNITIANLLGFRGKALDRSGQAQTFTAMTEGINSIQLYGIDSRGLSETLKSFTVKYDSQAPQLASTFSSAGKNYLDDSWAKQGVNITLSANDTSSGIEGIYYRLEETSEPERATDNTARQEKNYQRYNRELTANREGVYLLSWYARDLAGNQSAVQTKTIKIDYSQPKGSYDISYGNGFARVQLSGKDPQSGIARLEYRVDYKETQAYSKPLLLKTGDYLISYRAVNGAGLIANWQSITIKVQASSQAVTIVAPSLGQTLYWGTKGPSVQALAQEAGGLVWHYRLKTDQTFSEWSELLDPTAMDVPAGAGSGVLELKASLVRDQKVVASTSAYYKVGEAATIDSHGIADGMSVKAGSLIELSSAAWDKDRVKLDWQEIVWESQHADGTYTAIDYLTPGYVRAPEGSGEWKLKVSWRHHFDQDGKPVPISREYTLMVKEHELSDQMELKQTESNNRYQYRMLTRDSVSALMLAQTMSLQTVILTDQDNKLQTLTGLRLPKDSRFEWDYGEGSYQVELELLPVDREKRAAASDRAWHLSIGGHEIQLAREAEEHPLTISLSIKISQGFLSVETDTQAYVIKRISLTKIADQQGGNLAQSIDSSLSKQHVAEDKR